MKLPDNIWNSPVIRQRFFQEANFECSHGKPQNPHYWLVAPEADTKAGDIVLVNFKEDEFNVAPHELQQDFAENLKNVLQKQLHHDGLWVVGWTHPPASWESVKIDGDNTWGRLVMIWFDEDADPQYTVESDMPFIEMCANGYEYYAGLCAEAHEAWSESYGKIAMKDDFGLKEEQTTKAALSALS